MGRRTSLDLLATLFLMDPRMPLTLLAELAVRQHSKVFLHCFPAGQPPARTGVCCHHRTHHLRCVYASKCPAYWCPEPAWCQTIPAMPRTNLWPAGQCQERQQCWDHREFLSSRPCSFGCPCSVALIGLKTHLHWGFSSNFMLLLYRIQSSPED